MRLRTFILAADIVIPAVVEGIIPAVAEVIIPTVGENIIPAVGDISSEPTGVPSLAPPASLPPASAAAGGSQGGEGVDVKAAWIGEGRLGD